MIDQAHVGHEDCHQVVAVQKSQWNHPQVELNEERERLSEGLVVIGLEVFSK